MFSLFFIQAAEAFSQSLPQTSGDVHLSESSIADIVRETREFKKRYVDGHHYSEYRDEVVNFLQLEEGSGMDFIERLFAFRVILENTPESDEEKKIRAFMQSYREHGRNELDLTVREFYSLSIPEYEKVLKVFSESCRRSPKDSHLKFYIVGRDSLEIMKMLPSTLESLEIRRDTYMPIKWALDLLRQLNSFIGYNKNLKRLKVVLKVPTITGISGQILSEVDVEQGREFYKLSQQLKESNADYEIDCKIVSPLGEVESY